MENGYIEANGPRDSKGDMVSVKRLYPMPNMKAPGPMDCKMVMVRKHMQIVVRTILLQYIAGIVKHLLKQLSKVVHTKGYNN